MCGLKDLLIGAGESHRSQHFQVGPLVGREDRLPDPKIGDELYLGQPLQRCGAGAGFLVGMTLGRKIAVGKPGIVMCRADDPVEVNFVGRCAHNSIPGGSFWGTLKVGDSRDATG